MPPERAAARGASTAAWGPLKEAFTDPNLPGGTAPSGGTGRLFAVGAGCPDADRAPSDGVAEGLRTTGPGRAEGRPGLLAEPPPAPVPRRVRWCSPEPLPDRRVWVPPVWRANRVIGSATSQPWVKV